MMTKAVHGEKIAFLESFSEGEWLMNGHEKKDVKCLRGIYDRLLENVKGSYIELGCGTGIVCRYVHLFSGRHEVAGVDLSGESITLARKNNPGFERRFNVGDYLGSDPKALDGFSTININVLDNSASLEAAVDFLGRIADRLDIGTRVIIFSYGLDISNLAGKVTEKVHCLSLLKAERLFCVLEKAT